MECYEWFLLTQTSITANQFMESMCETTHKKLVHNDIMLLLKLPKFTLVLCLPNLIHQQNFPPMFLIEQDLLCGNTNFKSLSVVKVTAYHATIYVKLMNST